MYLSWVYASKLRAPRRISCGNACYFCGQDRGAHGADSGADPRTVMMKPREKGRQKGWAKCFLRLSLLPQHLLTRPSHVQIGRGASVHLARPELCPQKPCVGHAWVSRPARKKPKTSRRVSRSAPAPHATSRTQRAHPRGSCMFTCRGSSCGTFVTTQNAQSRVRPLDRRPFDGRQARRALLGEGRGGGTPTRPLHVPTATARPRVVDIDGLLGLRGGTRDLNARRPPTGALALPRAASSAACPAASGHGEDVVIWSRSAFFSV